MRSCIRPQRVIFMISFVFVVFLAIKVFEWRRIARRTGLDLTRWIDAKAGRRRPTHRWRPVWQLNDDDADDTGFAICADTNVDDHDAACLNLAIVFALNFPVLVHDSDLSILAWPNDLPVLQHNLVAIGLDHNGRNVETHRRGVESLDFLGQQCSVG